AACFFNDRSKASLFERMTRTVFGGHTDCRFHKIRSCRSLSPLARTLLTVEHVGASHLVVSTAHQSELNLILDILNVEEAAFAGAAHKRGHHLPSEPLDGLMDPAGSWGRRPFHRQECLGQRHAGLT